MHAKNFNIEIPREKKMSKISFTLGIIILAMIFEKNPTIAITIIAIYIAVKLQKKNYNANKKLIKSQEKNAINIIFTIEKGCKKISQAITDTQHPKNEFENEYITRNDPKVKIYTKNIYKY